MSWRFLRALSCPARIIAAVSPLLPVLAGIAALVAGVLVLRTYGPRYRVGRLLASTPQVSVAEAVAMAAGPARYVRISGRIDAEDEFEDDAHRPLVFRRTRLQLRRDDRWVAFEDDRRRVPFEVRDGLDGIAVDDAALDVGLVVVPRESVGTAADVADRVPAGTAPTTPVRLWVEQVSSVEHADRHRRAGPRRGGRAADLGGSWPAADPDHPRAGRGDPGPGRGRTAAAARRRWSASAAASA